VPADTPPPPLSAEERAERILRSTEAQWSGGVHIRDRIAREIIEAEREAYARAIGDAVRAAEEDDSPDSLGAADRIRSLIHSPPIQSSGRVKR